MGESMKSSFPDRFEVLAPSASGRERYSTSVGDAMIEAIAEAVAQKLERLTEISQRLMELEDAAKYLGLTCHALRHKAAVEIPCVRIDSKLRFDRRDLDRYIDCAKREGI